MILSSLESNGSSGAVHLEIFFYNINPILILGQFTLLSIGYGPKSSFIHSSKPKETIFTLRFCTSLVEIKVAVKQKVRS